MEMHMGRAPFQLECYDNLILPLCGRPAAPVAPEPGTAPPLLGVCRQRARAMALDLPVPRVVGYR
jgi:hypothetical protein